ncbi:hypothetical protein N9F08_01355, partial [bacterium]|nr:hypothetical protein [bacterium]
MRNLLIVCLLFSGVLLVSCTQEGSTDDEVGLENPAVDSNQNEIDQPEIVKDDLNENAVLTWKSYHNERFNFCVGYPTNFLKEVGESENHDGNTFENANGSSEMRASGITNVLEETIEEAFESATKNGSYFEDEQIITYKQQKGNWFVVSGKYYESIFYAKT